MEGEKKYKKIIIRLAALLCIIIIAFLGTEIYKNYKSKEQIYVQLPENIITPEEKPNSYLEFNSNNPEHSNSQSTQITETILSLHKGKLTNNESFKVKNMFPGDVETKRYCVKIHYKNNCTVRFYADIHNKQEKLSEVLKVKVILLNTGEEIYDGLIRDMSELSKHTLSYSSKARTEELYYEISAYLDTSVGNEYMGTGINLKADFIWGVEEPENLTINTVDTTNTVLWLGIMLISFFFIILFLQKRKRRMMKNA